LIDTQAFTIQINDLNETSTNINLVGTSVNENSAGGTFVGTFSGVDPDGGDFLTFSLVNSAGGRFMIDTATLELRVAAGASLNYEASPTHVITVRATDSVGHYFDKSFTITINNVNDAPVAVADVYFDKQLTTLRVTAANGLLANDYDEDGNALSVILVHGPTNGTLTLAIDGSLQYMPNNVFTGIDTFTYQITDGQLSSSIVTVTIDVLQTISTGLGGSSSTTGSTGSGSGSSGSTSGSGSSSGGSTGSSGTITSGGSTNIDSNSTSADESIPSIVGPIRASLTGRYETAFEDYEIFQGETIVDQSERNEQDASEMISLIVSALTRENQRTALAERRSGIFNLVNTTRVATSLFGGAVAIAPSDAIVSFTHFVFESVADAPQRTETRFSEVTTGKIVIGCTAVVSTSLSVGYVVWILRGGSLLTAFVSALPTWSSFDPLPVLQSFEKQNEDEDDTFLSIATRKAAKVVRKVVK